MSTPYYPYATPAAFSLGQSTGEITVERITASLKALAAQEAAMRRIYSHIVDMVTAGGVPGVMIRRYRDNAYKTNEAIWAAVLLYRAVGGASIPPMFLPTIEAKRDFTDAEVLTLDDLNITPCSMEPEIPVGAWWGAVAIVVSIAVAAQFTLPMISDLINAKHHSAVREYLAKENVARENTKQLDLIDKQLDRQITTCMGGSRDPKLYVTCINAIAPAIAKYQSQLAKVSDVPSSAGKSGLGFFGWLGVGVFFMAVGTAGYVFYTRRKSRDQVKAEAEGEENQ